MKFRKKKKLTFNQIKYIDDRINGIPTGRYFHRVSYLDYFINKDKKEDNL
jgi:hypothetical protein